MRRTGISSLMLLCLAVCSRYAWATPMVQIRLEVEDLLNNPITTIPMGQGFLLSGFVKDLRPTNANGVFAAYLDATYNSTLAAVNGSILHAAPYTNGTSGTSTPGLIDEVGGFDGFSTLGPTERLLFTVPLLASSTGIVTFASNPADGLGHDVLLYGLDNPVPPADVIYGATSLTIVPEPSSVVLAGLAALLLGACAWQKKGCQEPIIRLPGVSRHCVPAGKDPLRCAVLVLNKGE